MRRGFTLVEMLVALTLLGLVLVAALSLTRLSGRLLSDAAPPWRWRIAADLLLQGIQDEITTGDRLPGRSEPVVEVDGGELVIRTRRIGPGTGGAFVQRYAWDASRGTVSRSGRAEAESPAGRRAPPAIRRVLLEQVADWRCELSRREDRPALLTVRLTSADGPSCTRSFHVP